MSERAPAGAEPVLHDKGFADKAFSDSSFDAPPGASTPLHWMGWRLRLLVFAALLGCVGLFTLVRWAAESPSIDAVFEIRSDATAPVLAATSLDELRRMVGRPLQAYVDATGRRHDVSALLLQRSARWQVDDATREQQVRQQENLADALARGPVTLEFADGQHVTVQPHARGIGGVGATFWPLASLALLLYLVGVVVVLARPQTRNVLYFVITLSQAGNLLFIAIDSLRGLGLPPGAAAAEMFPRLAFDLISAAACVHAFALHPRRVPAADIVSGAAWALTALTLGLVQAELLPHLWWWSQGAILALAIGCLGVLTWSYRIEANPFAAVMRRLGLIAVATFALVSLAVALLATQPGVPHQVGVVGSVVWYLFLASLLLLVPFLARSKQVLREFAMLAGISTVATSLDLLFVAAFSLSQFTSLTVAVFLAVGVYAGTRQWILNQVVGTSVITTERLFEQLYRVAREVQQHPNRYGPLLEQLLRDLFEPMEVQRLQRIVGQATVVGNGSALVVPVRAGYEGVPPLALALRFARRGTRLFTVDDARLADRLVQQLRRAVAYDTAVERGRSEERMRIAQDLHDDIGARLLTLMYQAQSPEMEDYIRHTLLDLKTLTRGLAKSEHRLSHALAEWKADLTQRLNAAQVELAWSVDQDRDVRLSVVQWSSLTRVLRELVSNALYHARATRVDVALQLAGPRLRLVVADDGVGQDPQSWAHGLGLGGVRKRVKLLGGEVRWRDNSPRGIVCEVTVPEFAPTD